MGENYNSFFEQLAKEIKFVEYEKKHKLKLLIHVGTPKTGTTSLQTYLGKKQGKLRRNGILYPQSLDKIKNPSAPKHHWFEKNLISQRFDFFLENFKHIISQVDDNTHTIVLSSEGIYNYWWDFPCDSKKVLSQLSCLFDLQVWVWFRDPLEFIESYYKQCIRNPEVENNPCYGKSLSFAQMLDISWFSQHLNYQGFVSECQALFGEDSVVVENYDGDVVQHVSTRFGLNTPFDNPTPRQNNSLNCLTVKLLQEINTFNLKSKDKDRLMPYLKSIDEVLGRYDREALIDDVQREKVLNLYKPVKQ